MDVMVLVLTRAPVPAFRDAFGPGHLYSAETLPHHKERPGALQRTGNPGLPVASLHLHAEPSPSSL